jgi:hypothetical protein
MRKLAVHVLDAFGGQDFAAGGTLHIVPDRCRHPQAFKRLLRQGMCKGPSVPGAFSCAYHGVPAL